MPRVKLISVICHEFEYDAIYQAAGITNWEEVTQEERDALVWWVGRQKPESDGSRLCLLEEKSFVLPEVIEKYINRAKKAKQIDETKRTAREKRAETIRARKEENELKKMQELMERYGYKGEPITRSIPQTTQP